MCNKLTVAVVFGGQSSEHDVSCVSGATIMKALNPEKYEMILIGITKEGRWLLADSIKDVESGAWKTAGPRPSFLRMPEMAASSFRRGEGLEEKGGCDFPCASRYVR